MSNPTNPYMTGDPVGNTDMFVGRKDILEKVNDSLQNSQESFFLLYGQRRVGKTSILQYLEKQLENEEHFHPIYFSLQGKSDYSLEQVLKELAITIVNKLKIPEPHTPLTWEPEQAFHKKWLAEVFQRLLKDDSLVLLFDEFDVLADPSRKPISDTESLPASYLFKYLKTWTTDYGQRLRFVFVIGRNREDLSLVAQPLFKDTLPSCLVSLLFPDDVAAIVHRSEENNTLHWTDAAIRQVIQLTNGHPLFTQELCSQVWYLAYEQNPKEIPTVTDKDVEASVPEVLQQIEHHLVTFWDTWGAEERVAAAALSEIGSAAVTREQLANLLQEKSQLRIVIRQVQDAVQRLRERDVIEFTDNGSFKFRVELVRRWIRGYKQLDDVQSEIDDMETAAVNLYRAASQFYNDGMLEQAIDPARQAFETDPYHSGINQLWVDILISQEKLHEAQGLLEQLYEYEPSAATSRLIKLYLLQAKNSQGDPKRLEWYEKVLKINPSQSEALKETIAIWEYRAGLAEHKAAKENTLENLEEAYIAYQRANRQDKAHELGQQIQQRVISEGRQRLDKFEREKRYPEAVTMLDDLEHRYPIPLWTEYRERLTPKADLAVCYQKALEALHKDERVTAQTLLIQIIVQDPKYEDATLYLHQAVKGEGFYNLSQRLIEMQGRCAQNEAIKQELQIELEQVQINSARLEERLTQAYAENQQLIRDREQAERRAKQEIASHQQCEHETESQKQQLVSLQEKMHQQEQEYTEILRVQKENTKQQIQEIQKTWVVQYQQLEEENDRGEQADDKLKKRIEKLEKDLQGVRDLVDKKQRVIRKNREKIGRLRMILTFVFVLFLISVGYILFIP